MKTCILIPCYNEGQAIISLLKEVETTLKKTDGDFTMVVMDDASSDETLRLLLNHRQEPTIALKILQLPFNMGHQSAIAQGLLYASSINAERVIVMDGDGEDDPSAIPQLLAITDFDIIHVVRKKRVEGLRFKISYAFYRILFLLFTGQKMNFGNYCMVNAHVLKITKHQTFIHFAAFLTRLKLKSTSIRVDRRRRISGKSKMNSLSLIQHAFRSFIEYAEETLLIFLKLFVLLSILFLLVLIDVLYLKLFTTKAIIGWASTLSIGLLASALICIGFFVTGTMLLNFLLSRRQPPEILYEVVR